MAFPPEVNGRVKRINASSLARRILIRLIFRGHWVLDVVRRRRAGRHVVYTASGQYFHWLRSGNSSSCGKPCVTDDGISSAISALVDECYAGKQLNVEFNVTSALCPQNYSC